MIETPVVLQVAVNGYADRFAEFFWRTHKWADSWKYHYRLVTGPCNMPRDDCGWLKLACVERLLLKYRTVFLVDADAFVTEHCPSLKAVLEDSDGEIFARLGFTQRINSGVMIFHHGEPKSTLREAFKKLFACCDKPVPAEDKAPQENGHVIHCWKNWPTFRELEPAWNMNKNVWDYNGRVYVNHAEDPGMMAFKHRMREESTPDKQPLWYEEIPERRRHSRAVRVRFYARKLSEIGII